LLNRTIATVATILLLAGTATSAQAQFVARKPGPQAISEFVRRIFQDSKGNLWFGTNGDGVCVYERPLLTYYSTRQGFGGDAVRGIVEDGDGNVWFATSGGITRYDGAGYVNFTVEDGLSHDDVWSLLIDREGTIWAGTFGGACRFDG
jgi:ligand-binding sensor domain-containing protein